MDRSENMRRIRNKNSKPELLVRRLIYAMGYRYRLHGDKLPGSPDIVFTRKKKVIFVHGCFWHLHEGCKYSRIPKSNSDYWEPKLQRNKARDVENQNHLRETGWEYLVIWECQIIKIDDLLKTIKNYLESGVIEAGNHYSIRDVFEDNWN